jgi:isoprenylcysteine carboxyl methyltransferase (ICMT) family protein YpbQ
MSFSIKIFFCAALAFRLTTLAISIRNEKLLKRAGAVEYGRENSLLLAAIHAIYYIAAAVEGSIRHTRLDGYSIAGMSLYSVGAIALLMVIGALGRQWTIRLMMAPNHVLVNHSIFRLVRHPNYFLNIPAELFGLALACHAIVTMTVSIPLYLIPLSIRIREEQRVMSERFGDY